ncbi:alpha/beta-hydrolase [Macrolepiota fuliginosa MF-IS2]|uniref:Alpha/beta-hydrolase n=1 Tax=Macrolepiota fuliginosa MF-IS2 TaxID=1400762 RepID=A0A9P6BZQ2_9AGAR|nr:alpha/beta-hydrolase [Macrolepiota fuliginosa MF-IS2]
MLSNSLTRDMGLKVGPVMLGTFIKHYFDRVKTRESADPDKLLRQDEILYDEAFNIIRAICSNTRTSHTVEEIQGFSNTQTPSSPWTHLVRVLVPLSSCAEAAMHLVKALGGEDKAREIVGGVKWWQVRGIEGINGQWITAKRDWREAKRRHKIPENSDEAASGNNADTYEKYMDEMRCILYIHGGGYYFGSVDQERYCIQRHARKINGRVFAIDYRLAPQYPFPCGLQDCLAAYLYLIRPPPEADHSPINPAHIVVAGDSAGGGMSLALLQVIRDAGLPMPAGGVLISPWCDLTHSFPSVHTNTDTDIIPPTGLSFHKPSILWPPPPPDVSIRVHASLRQKLRDAFRMDGISTPGKIQETIHRTSLEAHSASEMPVDVGENVPVPPINVNDPQKIHLVTEAGESLAIDQQVHFYAQNGLLVHPLVSPALGYLGGLPPLFFIASEKEVLRDEIIYTAHRAANPSKYPVKDQTKGLYPLLQGIEERHPQPTSVHLQVYDGTCHVLPVLFLFSTPAKYCFRAMASFTKFVTGMPLSPPVSASESLISKMARAASSPEIQRTSSPEPMDNLDPSPIGEGQLSSPVSEQASENSSANNTPTVSRKHSLRRALSHRVAKASRVLLGQSHDPIQEGATESSLKEGSTLYDTGTFGRRKRKSHIVVAPQERHAGEPLIYEDINDRTAFDMIRERVSTQGVIRPLEPESELDAFTVPEGIVGTISELGIKRYINSEAHFRQKFSQTYKAIEKSRKKHLDRVAKKDRKRLEALRASQNNGSSSNGSSPNGSRFKVRESMINSPGWGHAWALDELERPPPSSIAARRDTDEARKLAQIADRAIMEEAGEFNTNSLWSIMMDFLTITSDRNGGNGSGRKTLTVDSPQEAEGDRVPEGTPERVGKGKGYRKLSEIFLGR